MAKSKKVDHKKMTNNFEVENFILMNLDNKKNYLGPNDPLNNSFVLFEGEKGEMILKPNKKMKEEYFEKLVKKYEEKVIKKEQLLLIYFYKHIAIDEAKTAGQYKTYDEMIETVDVQNLEKNATLCNIESIKPYGKKNEKAYLIELKGLSRYELSSFEYEAEKSTKKEESEHFPLERVSKIYAKRKPVLDDEESFSKVLDILSSSNISSFEKSIEKLILQKQWNNVLIWYYHFNRYTNAEIDAWAKWMASNSLNFFISTETDSLLKSLINVLLNFLSPVPKDKYSIYLEDTTSRQFLALQSLYMMILKLLDKAIKDANLSADTQKLLLPLIHEMLETDFFKEIINKSELQESEVNDMLEKHIADIITSYVAFKKIDKQFANDAKVLTAKMLNQDDNSNKKKPKRNEAITDALLESEINKKMRDRMDKQQKEFLLREKMRAIKESLEEEGGDEDEDEEFKKVISDPVLKQIYPESVLKLIKSEKEKLKRMMSSSPDANIATTYIEHLKELPWRKVEVENLDIKKARKILDKNHYGLKEVKERIIEYLALITNHNNIDRNKNKQQLVDIEDGKKQIDLTLFKENEKDRIQKKFNNVPILALVGPPGTGKTSLARAIAEALNKSYVKISLGGVHDESEIRGHRRTYVGAMPGKIIKGVQQAGVSNPLILLDEIDKMSSDVKGDPASAMLEVLDPEQNTKFQDNYLEHEYDLSKVLFVATANYYENIPAPLIDRIEIIELNSYTISEKIKIAREHLIDNTIEQAGLKPEQFQIDDNTIEYIIKYYTAEAGVRGLKRSLDKIARKIVTKIVEGEKISKFVINEKIATDLLGVPKFTEEDDDKEPQVGSVNGLAYSSIGGTTLKIEVATFKSKNPGIKLTGSLKDVMQESAKIALSYVRANAKKFGVEDFEFDEHEIHIHVPEGAVPKDGPSAGITFTTALVSALSKKPVSPKVAMTGEITLRGKVLEIGGLKEKTFAAYKKGVTKVFIPINNKKNLVDIPDEIKKQITFVPVRTYDEIYNDLFKDAKPIKSSKKKKTTKKTTAKKSKDKK